jgi:hypothetical protein
MTDNLISREIIHELKDNRSVEEQLRDHYRDIFRLYQGIFVDIDTGTITFKGGMINKIDRVTSNTTLDATYHVVFTDTDGGVVTITLPEGVNGTQYRIANVGTSGNTLTLSPDGPDLLLSLNEDYCLLDGDVLIINFEDTEGWF